MPSTLSLLRSLLASPLRGETSRLLVIAAALIILSASQGALLFLVKGFVSALFTAHDAREVPLSALLPPKLLRLWPHLASLSLERAALGVWVPAGILLAGILKTFATYLYQLNQQALALKVARSFRERVFRAILSLTYVGVKARETGEWMSLVMSDALVLQTRFTDLMTGLVKDSVVTVACFLALTVIHWPTGLVIMLLSPLVALGMGRTGRRIARFAEAFQRDLGKLASLVFDLRSRFDFIRAQHGEVRESARFRAINHDYFEHVCRSILTRSAFAPVLELLGFGAFALFIQAVGHGLWGHFTPDVMLQALVGLGLLLRPLREMGEQLSRWHETKGTLARSLEVLQTLERGGSSSLHGHLTSARPVALRAGPLQVRELRAGFGPSPQVVATDVTVAAGRRIAVIGPSGAGKSTLLKALAGLIRPISWSASQGGGALHWEQVAVSTSMVSQEPFLFDGDLASNLRYGAVPGEEPSDEDLWHALSLVNMAPEVRSWPDGMATRLRAVGSNLSGGQLQRLVIARALLRRKPILLLDEATAAVDAASERDITMRVLAACQQDGMALIAVTHRLTWLEHFDEVWFVEGGRLCFRGHHSTLMKEPRYEAFCRAADG